METSAHKFTFEDEAIWQFVELRTGAPREWSIWYGDRNDALVMSKPTGRNGAHMVTRRVECSGHSTEQPR